MLVLVVGGSVLELRSIKPGGYGRLSCAGAAVLGAVCVDGVGGAAAVFIAVMLQMLRWLLYQSELQAALTGLVVEVLPLSVVALVVQNLPEDVEQLATVGSATVTYWLVSEILLRRLYGHDYEATVVRRRFLIANLIGAVPLVILVETNPLAAVFLFPLLLVVQQGGYGAAIQLRRDELEELSSQLKESKSQTDSAKDESQRKARDLENKVREQKLLEEFSLFFAHNPSVEQILVNSVGAIGRLVPSHHLVIFRFEQGHFHPVEWSERSQQLISRMPPQGLAESVLTRAFQSGRLCEPEKGELTRSTLVREAGPGLAVPLPGYGAAYLASSKPLQVSDRRAMLLLTVASQVALGLASAQYRAQLETALEEVTTAHQQLEASQAQLVQSSKMAAIGQLAAGVAHEINSPLAAVLLQIQMGRMRLESGNLEKVAKSFEVAERSTTNAQQIIEKLLRFSRESSPVKGQLKLQDVVSETLELVGEQVRREGVELSFESQDSASVTGDPIELQQILTNLLLNARDAALANREQREPRVKVSVEGAVDEVLLRVTDSGAGISEEVSKRIFEPFFTTKLIGEGTGLGLSISYQIAKSHGGELQAENSPGGGAVFTLSLPRADEALPV